MVVTLLSMVLHPREIRWPGGGALYMLIVLTLWMGVTTLAAILLEPSIERYLFILKVMFMTLVIAMVVRTREEIVGLVWVIVASMSFYGIKGGIFTVLSGGGDRVWGPPDSVIEGNNELAVALVMIVPLLFYLSRHLDIGLPSYFVAKSRRQLVRLTLIVAMVLCSIAVLGSQSRGALLAVTAMLMSMWWRSDRKVPVLAAMLLVIPIVLSMLPESWYSRMETIGAYEEDASAMGRINAWTMAYNIAKDRITGAGFATAAPGIYAQYAPNPDFVIVAHSIYFQVLGEHGFVGLAIYLTMWLMTYLMAGRVARQASAAVGLEWAAALAGMVRVSLLGFAVGGAFLSLAYWDMPFYLLVVVVVLHAHVKSVVSRFPVGRLAANVG
ncbi:MAG: putative O-glycosylation ligase, exosortase A system-associated [Betaproteobacteria bacterium]|nr:putative O-glycosylation ligase, exosortase A system-associated [Betaproteobacteria bacterium]